MEALQYLAEVSLYWLLLYACYWLLLRKHTFFGWNRAYLLGALLVSFALPLLQYPEAAPVVPQAVYVVATVPAVVIRPEMSVMSNTPDWTQPDWTQWVWMAYAMGVVGMSIRLYRYLRRLFRFIRQGETIEMEGYTLVLMNDDRRSGGRRSGDRRSGWLIFVPKMGSHQPQRLRTPLRYHSEPRAGTRAAAAQSGYSAGGGTTGPVLVQPDTDPV